MGSRLSSRRALLAGLAALPIAAAMPARAQERPKVVGYLSGGQGPEWLVKLLALRGYVEGRNVRIETRIPPDWQPASLEKAARELVAARPDVLYAIMANRVGALAAATRTIPIVTGGVPDPVGAGFAKSLRRPGGNVTGLSWGFPETAEIMIGILKSVRPGLARVGGLFASGVPAEHMGGWWVEPCRRAGLEWSAATVPTIEEADRLLARLAGQAAIVAPMKDPALGSAILPLAIRHRVAAVGNVDDGALMTYGMDFEKAEERIASLLDQVLRGMNPATIPFELPDRSSFEWNRRTAGTLGIELPRDASLRVTRFVD
jgi:putative ABC transport system substrate-binding protein